MSAALTDQQQKVLDFMVLFLLMNDQLPTSKAIAGAFGYSSNNAGHTFILKLAAKGILEKNEIGNYRFKRTQDAKQHPALRTAMARICATRSH